MLIDLSLPLDLDPQNNPFMAQRGKQAKLGHQGTHLDIMATPGPALESFICRGLLVEVQGEFQRPLTPADLGGITPGPGDLVAFHTGWLARFYGSEYYFDGHPELGQPELSDQLIDLLLAARVGFIALDAPGAERRAGHHAVDLRCASRGVYIIEHVANLERLAQREFVAYCFPLRLVNSTGLPVRLLASC